MQKSSFLVLSCVLSLCVASTAIATRKDPEIKNAAENPAINTQQTTRLPANTSTTPSQTPQSPTETAPSVDQQMPITSPQQAPHILPQGIPQGINPGINRPTVKINSLLGCSISMATSPSGEPRIDQLEYDLACVKAKPEFTNLPVNKTLLDSFKINVNNAMLRTSTLFVFVLKKTPNNATQVSILNLPIIQITKNGGILAKNMQNQKLVYYNGDLLQTPQWKQLPVGGTLQDDFNYNVQSDNYLVKKNIVLQFTKHEDPTKNLPILFEP